MNKNIKQWIIDVLIWTGIFSWISSVWQLLEETFEGGIQQSISDSIIAVILVTFIWIQIRKLITIKE
nr:MAG TPA: hypothetical protein [Caudoviricetes sp.]